MKVGFLIYLFFFKVIAKDYSGTRVLCFYSYDAAYINNKDVNRGFYEGLIYKSFIEHVNLELFTYYLNSKGKTQKDIDERGDLEVERMWKENGEEFDILVLFDDDAINYYVAHMNHTRYPGSKVVYTGMNGNPGRNNLLGVFEPTYLAESICLFHTTIMDLTNRSVLVLFDNTTTGNVKKNILKYESKWSNCADYIYGRLRGHKILNLATLSDLEREIINAKNDPHLGMIFFGIDSLSTPNIKLQSDQIVAEYLRLVYTYDLRVIEFAGTRGQTEAGLLGGQTVDFDNMGEKTADLAEEIIRGVNHSIETAGSFENRPWTKLYFNSDRIDNLTRDSILPRKFPKTLLDNAAKVFRKRVEALNDAESSPNYFPLYVIVGLLVCFVCCACCAVTCVCVVLGIRWGRDKYRQVVAKKTIKMGSSAVLVIDGSNNSSSKKMMDLENDEGGGYSINSGGFESFKNDDFGGIGDDDDDDDDEDDEMGEDDGELDDDEIKETRRFDDDDDDDDDLGDLPEDDDGRGDDDDNIDDIDDDVGDLDSD